MTDAKEKENIMQPTHNKEIIMLEQNVAIVAIGGAAGNFINNLQARGGIPYKTIVINSDAEALKLAQADTVIHLQDAALNPDDLGTDGDVEIGHALALACKDKIMPAILAHQTIVMIAGLGGGTGSGAMPLFAAEALKHGKNVICIVSMPFAFEGNERAACAEAALAEIKQKTVPTFVINNQALFEIADEKTTLAEGFRMIDDSLCGFLNSLIAADFDAARIGSSEIQLAA